MKKEKHEKNFAKRAFSTALACMMLASSATVTALAEEKTTDDSNYVYGTVNLPYADYYYGELNNVAENATLQLNAEDKVAPLRAEGILDAISSATNSKWKSYGATYYGPHEEDAGGYIYGIGNCSVAVPKSLYEAAQQSIAKGETSSNSVLSIVKDFTANEDQSKVPAEYKVLNGDGTLTETRDSQETIVVDAVDKPDIAVLENNTTYGHYEVDITDENLPVGKENLQGAIIEATDKDGNVAKYALLHSDNLWFQAGHIAWAVEDGFLVHSANILKYKQFADIPGKTITKVRYIVSDGADVEYNTNLFCKYLLTKEQGYSAETDAVYADGAEIKLTPNVPEDSNYKLASVQFGKTTLTEGTDYTYEKNTLKIKNTNNTAIGTYTLTFSDDKYANTSVSVQFTSSMTADQIKFADNKLTIETAANVSVADYVKAITAISVNGSALRSTSGVINEDGTINFDAEVNFHGNKTVVFPDGNTEYTLEVKASGYPTVSGTVKSPAKEEPTVTEPTATEPTATEPTATEPTATEPTATEPTATEPKTTQPATTKPVTTQPTTTKPVVKKTTVKLAKSSAKIYVKKTTTIKATVTNGKGKTTYKSNKTTVAKVSSKGVVTGLKKGTAKITVTNNGVKKVFTVTVQNPKLNKTSVSLKKNKTFTIKITGKVGKATFKSSKTSVATVNKNGKITAKKKGNATITVKTNGVTLKLKVKVK